LVRAGEEFAALVDRGLLPLGDRVRLEMDCDTPAEGVV